jgi:non-ribosomal peptide synthetase-like protein
MANSTIILRRPPKGTASPSGHGTVVPATRTLKTCAPRPGSQPRRLHQFFESSCDRTPNAPALICGADQLTYADLDARANRLSRYLVGRGIRPGDRVGLLLERSVDTYAALLAVLKCGAAYVPLDPSLPPDRLTFIAEDSALTLLLTAASFQTAVAGMSCRLLELEAASPAIELESDDRLVLPEVGDPLCYIIYTSGTTGRPKGVMINHSSICNLLEVCLPLYGVTAQDRVYQGITLSFDFSIEEIWHAWGMGATLVAGPNDHRRLGAGLADFLDEQRINVLCCTPTLLAALGRDVPTLHTLILGGEGCPPDLVKRRSRPGLRILNTYGLTETTVTCSWTEMHPDRPVTIGKALPTYTMHVLDEALRPLPVGEVGELYVGGPGVAGGYVNRPELTTERFLPDPFTTDRPGAKLYKTGDLGRINAEGEVECLGRVDSQIKIRGYRIELGEIEAVLMECAEVANAIVVPLKEDGVVKNLAAYVTLRNPASNHPAVKRQLHATMSQRLPRVVVPAFIEILDAIPTLPSGKADRSRLPAPAAGRLPDAGGAAAASEEGADAIERAILEVYRALLGSNHVGRQDSFFELGGHSMLAAQAVSRFRQMPELGALTIRDLYEFPTAAALAARLRGRAEALTGAPAAPQEAPREPYQASRGQFLAVATAQTAVILTVLCSGGFLAYGVLYGLYQAYLALPAATPYWFWVVLGGAVLLTPVGFATTLVVGVVTRRLLVGPTREGDHPVWSWGYFRWWLANLLQAPLRGIAANAVGTPLAPFFYRLLGARIGKRVYLGAPLPDPDLITIEDGASISELANFGTHGLEGGVLQLRRVHIGKDAFVGGQSHIGGGARLGDGARLHPLSSLGEGAIAPPGTEWRGSPAVPVEPGTTELSRLLRRHEEEARPEDSWRSLGDALRFGVLSVLYGYALTLIFLVPFALEIALLYLLGVRLSSAASFNLAVLAPATLLFAGVRFVGGLAALLAGKWLLTGRARPGTIPLNSHAYLRRWFCSQLMATLTSPYGFRPICETLLMPVFCRWLGMRVGRRVELSDAVGFQPDLVTLGDGVTLADGVVLGAPVVHRGRMTLGRVSVGERTFLGNGAVLPITTPELGARSLIGVLSIAPDAPPAASDWLGSPPMRLPNRKHWSGGDARTFNPPKRLVLARALCNVFKIVLPGALVESIAWVTFKLGLLAFLAFGALGVLPVIPLLVLGATCASLALPVILKWALIGRFRSGQRYLWSFWMWRVETVAEIDILLSSAYRPLLNGTPWLPVLYRLQGARIGKQVCILDGAVLEMDLTTIGDHVTLQGILQTHLFEDRVMKLGTADVEGGASIGNSIVLYDSRVGAGASLGDLSLVMKNETLLPGRRYRGLPAENVEPHQAQPTATLAAQPPVAA